MLQEKSVLIRDMKAGEEKALLQAARRAFLQSPMEQIAISRPKAALVVEVDGEIAGAMFLRIFDRGEKKTGYLDLGFVVKEYRGLGIGRMLYPAAVTRLGEMGCDIVTAMVIDDNVASWKSLKNQGFGAPSLSELVSLLGFGPAFVLWLRTLFCVACGARLWVNRPVKERGSATEFLFFLCVNVLLFLPGALLRMVSRPGAFIPTLLAYPFVLLAGAFFGGVGCLVAGGAWHFSFPRGGLLISLLLNGFKVLFPMVGRWYLIDPQATPGCRKAMGLQSTIEWLGLLLLFCLGAWISGGQGFLYQCAALAASLLVYRIIPFMPFGSFGGARVWAWNKAVFAVLAVATLALLFAVIF